MQTREDLFNHVGKYENMVDLGRPYNCRGTKVGDPTMVKTKGAHMNKSFWRKRRCCKNYYTMGHTIRKCPKFVAKKDENNKNDKEKDILDLDLHLSLLVCFLKKLLEI